MQEIKQDKSPIKQRILFFLKEKGISMYNCYAKTGITRGILAQNNGISEDNITRFLAYYVEMNTDWLILGRGSMLRSDEEHSTSQPVGQPIIQQDSSLSESVYIYKMYEEEKEENKALIRENGCLEERIRTLESKLQEYEPFSELPKGKPKGLGSSETVKSANIKKHTSSFEHTFDSTTPKAKNP